MSILSKFAGVLLAGSAVLLPNAVSGQSRPPAGFPPAVGDSDWRIMPTLPTLTDEQQRGEALFLVKCPLCHVPSAQKKRLRIEASTLLVGLFAKPSVNEADVRQVILQGLPNQMPGFQYTLDAKELDDLIAYLKVRSI